MLLYCTIYILLSLLAKLPIFFASCANIFYLLKDYEITVLHMVVKTNLHSKYTTANGNLSFKFAFHPRGFRIIFYADLLQFTAVKHRTLHCTYHFI